MKWFRVCKYIGSSLDSDYISAEDSWTNICDVGREFGGRVLTAEQYRNVEDRYVAAVEAFLLQAGVATLRVHDLDVHADAANLAVFTAEFGYSPPADKSMVGIAEVRSLVRLNLRELLWCRLSSPLGSVRFGYDLYVYLGPTDRARRFAEEPLDLVVDEVDRPDDF